MTVLNDNTQDHFASNVSDRFHLFSVRVRPLVLVHFNPSFTGDPARAQRTLRPGVSALHAPPSHHVWVAAAEAEHKGPSLTSSKLLVNWILPWVSFLNMIWEKKGEHQLLLETYLLMVPGGILRADLRDNSYYYYLF